MSELQLMNQRNLATQPLNFYLDLNIVQNNDSPNASQTVPVNFNEIRTQPFLNYPANYQMSIVRFFLDSSACPCVIPDIQLNQNDPNLTSYSFTLTYNYLGTDYEFRQYVIFVPQDLTQPTPISVNGNFQTPPYIKYYYINTFQKFLQMVNKALSDGFDGLNALIVNAGGTLPTANKPFFEIDPYNFNLVLNADIAGFDDALAQPIKIYMNNSMFTLFSNFQTLNYGSNVSNGKNYLLNIYSTNGTNSFIFPTYTALQMYGEGQSTVALWNPVQAIVFTTGIIPVIPTASPNPIPFGSDTSLNNFGNNANIENILTDFIVPFDNTNTYKPQIHFQTTGPFRFQDLFGVSALQAIQLQVKWRDRYGNLYPFEIKQGGAGSIKLYFQRKDFGNINL
jgi:hypothetical protein